MKYIYFLIVSAMATPGVIFAQGLVDSPAGSPLEVLLINIVTFANDILIPFIIAIGFVVFVWGMFQYFIAGGANDEAKSKGKSLMIYATLGFVFIIVFWGVINLLTQSLGFGGESVNNIPSVPVATSP